MLLIPKTEKQGRLAIILEYKVGHSQEVLEKRAQEALNQIIQKNSLAEIVNYPHVRESLAIGLSFWKKDFSIQVGKIF